MAAQTVAPLDHDLGDMGLAQGSFQVSSVAQTHPICIKGKLEKPAFKN
jgi:hypothetical protein